MHTTSPSLLERVRRTDDPVAWRRFVALYAPLLERWAKLAGLEEHEANDLVQEVLLALVTKLRTFVYDPDRKNFRGWLKTMTVNKCRDLQRKRRLGRADDEILDQIPAAASEAFWEAEYRTYLIESALRIVRSEVEPRTYQACAGLLEGKNAQQVAAELGMSEGAVYVAKSRIMARLRTELAGLMD